MKAQRGFTLIELIVVIVILGILAATAMPKFVDFSSDASLAAAKGVAGGLESASAINYAGSMAGKSVSPTTLSGVGCTGLSGLLLAGIPSNITMSGAGTCTSAGSTIACSVTETKGGVATANVTCYGS